jgi:hypothetical protein
MTEQMIEHDDDPTWPWPFPRSAAPGMSERNSRVTQSAASAAASIAASTVSQNKPMVADNWAALLQRTRGTAPAENTAAVPAQAEVATGWDKAFASARQRRDAETLELAEGAEEPNLNAVDAWSAALERARAGGR